MVAHASTFSVAQHEQSSPEQRAVRLKRCRDLLGLSRDKIHERYGIARGTLQNWESARFGGLTEKGAKLMTQALLAEGLFVSLDWLLYNIGPEPQTQDTLHADPTLDPTRNRGIHTDLHLTEELLCFRHFNPESIDMVVTDNSMAPLFRTGDYVAGNRRYQDRVAETVNRYCIVQTENHGTLLRYVRSGDTLGRYHLCAQAIQTAEQPVLYNVTLLSSAPVIWTRRPDGFRLQTQEQPAASQTLTTHPVAHPA